MSSVPPPPGRDACAGTAGWVSANRVTIPLPLINQGGSFLDNPAHPYTIAGNIVWALLFGWPLVLAHLSAALIQALTIVGLSTAILNVKMATYVM